MSIQKFKVAITQVVEVKLDDSKLLGEEFNRNFSSSTWPVRDLEEHAVHIAQMESRGRIDWNEYLEGYGDLNYKYTVIDQDATIID